MGKTDVQLVPMAEKPITAELAEKLRPTPALHLWRDDDDFFSAENLGEANALRAEYHGDEGCTGELVQVPDNILMKSYVDSSGAMYDGPGPGIKSVERTAAEWAAQGKGYVFSEDV